MGKRGPKIKEFNLAWNPNLAYCIGLFATDGCLYGDGRHIDFTSADIQLVRLFKELMGFPNPISYKISGSSSRQCPRLQLSSVGFYQWLLKIGLTPRKSLTLGPLNVPNQYFSDFIRGCFDGDGSIYSYMDPRWANSHMFYISFASGSITFVKWLQEQLKKILDIHGHIAITKHETKHKFYQLRFAKTESIVLIKKMYYNKQVPCLERKRHKIRAILRKHIKIQSENNRIFLKKTAKIDI